jgi:hypothetical protein
MQTVTSPEEWRRRARLAAPVVVEGDLRSAVAGLAALEAGDEATARQAARVCRDVVRSQPDDVPGVMAAPGLVVRAHAGPQPFGLLGTAVGFLARAFEQWGEDEDLDAAIELHDLTVALGDDVWDGPEAWRVGWGAALLHGATGDEAFLATAERVGDLLCETQRPDGTWGSSEVTAEAALVLREMADAVEGRAGVE